MVGKKVRKKKTKKRIIEKPTSKEEASDPLEAWKNKTEQVIKNEGITMGQEEPNRHRNPSADGGPDDQASPEWPSYRK